MYRFTNDYSEGAHEKILEALTSTNREQTTAYGLDLYCEQARERIGHYLNHPESAVHFLVGGTQTNLTLIAAALRPHQGVISAVSGHINTHESGAIEASGHKVLPIPSDDGKVTAAQVEEMFRSHYADCNAEHLVQPGMLYISHPSEVGTLYTLSELKALKGICETYNAPLYVDGARLGCGLTSSAGDITLSDLARYTDAFSIGGTKMGALFGEALVINTPVLNRDFRYILKQRGGMLAKGRLLGLQFLTLFTDDLYFQLARHANGEAQRLADGIAALGYRFFVDSPTNQIFPILPRALLERLSESFEYSFWQRYDEENDVVRFCASWATDSAQVDALLAAMAEG